MNETEKKLINKFKKFKQWEKKYAFLIKLGKKLPKMNNNKKITKNLIKGCQSKIWLYMCIKKPDIFILEGYSESLIIKGILQVLMMIYSKKKLSEIMKIKHNFISEIGFDEFMSLKRTNGLFKAIKNIKLFTVIANKILINHNYNFKKKFFC